MTKIQISKIVLVIWYWNLRFVCNLVLGVWDFITPPLHYSKRIPHDGKTGYLESSGGELLTSKDVCNGKDVCTMDSTRDHNKAPYALPLWARDESPLPQ